MHRVDADGFKTESGNRRFEDQNLPGTAGTLDAELWKNAVQEEIAHLIEYTGATLASTGLIDESNNWQQLRQAIFSSAKIDSAAITDGAILTIKLDDGAVTNAKVTDVSVAKLTAGAADTDDLDITLVAAPSTFNWLQNVEKLVYNEDDTVNIFGAEMRADFLSIDTDSTTYARLESDFLRFTGNSNHTILVSNDEITLTATGTNIITTIDDLSMDVTFDDTSDEKKSRVLSTEVSVGERASGAGSSAMEVVQTARGVRYPGSASPGQSAFRTKDVRQGVFRYTGNWTALDYVGGGEIWNFQASAGLTLTLVPAGSEIYQVWVRYAGATSAKEKIVPAKIGDITDDATDVVLQSITLLDNSTVNTDGPANGSNVDFFVTYEGNNLA